MTISEQRAAIIQEMCNSARIFAISRHGEDLKRWRDALEASEAEKARLIEAVRAIAVEMAAGVTGDIDAANDLESVCDEAEAQ